MMGHRYIQACRKNGTAMPTSRYLTLSAVSHSPKASAVNTHNSTQTGTRTICQPGTKRYQAINSPRITPWIAISASPTATPVRGRISLGKYALVSKEPAPTTLVVTLDSAPEKYIQGINAAKLKIAYGASSEGILASQPKITVKMIIDTSGLMIAQPYPMMLCR